MKKIRKTIKLKPKELKELFDYVKLETNNLRILNSKLLVEKQELMVIFRLLAGLSLTQFSKEIGKSPARIADIEKRRYDLSQKGAEFYTEKIKEFLRKHKIEELDFDKIKSTYENFYTKKLYHILGKRVSIEKRIESGKKAGLATFSKYGRDHYKKIAKLGARKGGLAVAKKYGPSFYKKIGPMTVQKYGIEKAKEWGTIGGLKTARNQKLTKQEESVKNILEQSKVVFEPHAELKGSNRNYIVDFAIPNSKNPQFILESTSQKQNCYEKALSMSDRINDIKKIYPHIKSIAIIPHDFCCESVMSLSQTFDCVLLDSFTNQLTDILNTKNFKTTTNNSISELIPSTGFQTGAIKTVTKQREYEELLLENKLKESCIDFECQGVLHNPKGLVRIVDFSIPSSINPKIVIETTRVFGKNKKTHIRTANRLLARFKMLKDFYCPNSKFMAVINIEDKKLLEEIKNILGNVASVHSIDNIEMIKDEVIKELVIKV